MPTFFESGCSSLYYFTSSLARALTRSLASSCGSCGWRRGLLWQLPSASQSQLLFKPQLLRATTAWNSLPCQSGSLKSCISLFLFFFLCRFIISSFFFYFFLYLPDRIFRNLRAKKNETWTTTNSVNARRSTFVVTPDWLFFGNLRASKFRLSTFLNYIKPSIKEAL